MHGARGTASILVARGLRVVLDDRRDLAIFVDHLLVRHVLALAARALVEAHERDAGAVEQIGQPLRPERSDGQARRSDEGQEDRERPTTALRSVLHGGILTYGACGHGMVLFVP